MSLGYDRSLYILTFDHRASFQKGLLGIEGTPSSAELVRIGRSKQISFEGLRRAVTYEAAATAAGASR